MQKRYFFVLSIMLLFLQSCAIGTPQNPVSSAPVVPAPPDPLMGKILDTESGKLISFPALMENIGDADIIYLSEKHDNPDHHKIQHRVIQALVDDQKKPSLGFEFFSVHHTPTLLNFVEFDPKAHKKMMGKKPPKIVKVKGGHGDKFKKKMEAKLRKNLGWENQSDSQWAFYYDLLKRARDNGLWAAGLDLPSAQKRRISKKGWEGLTALERQFIFSSEFSNPAYETRMKKIFKQVHCGMGSDALMGKLYNTWVARNDTMAQSIIRMARETKEGPVVVIVGGGHTEYGLGIVERIKALAPNLVQTAVALTEVSSQPSKMDAYLTPLDLEGFEPAMPAPFIWFTPRVSNEDPCKKYKKMLERMKKKSDI